MSASDAIDAWHFLPADRMTRYEPRELVTVGSILVVEHKPILCVRGLHASVRAIDALQYAPGPIACRVKVWGEVVRGGDKLAGTHRECVAMVDATNVLHEFACCCAEAALLMADVTDARCWHAIEAKRAWVRGDLHDQGLAAARDAAWDAARDAAWDAARDAAWEAARDASRDAAWEAAWDAARAAWDAARDAAWEAARDAALAAARDAAWDAAWAAWEAAWDEQNATLEAMLLEVM